MLSFFVASIRSVKFSCSVRNIRIVFGITNIMTNLNGVEPEGNDVGVQTDKTAASAEDNITFSLLKSTVSQEYMQTARQATYYASSAARNKAFAEENVSTVILFTRSCHSFCRKTAFMSELWKKLIHTEFSLGS